MIRPMQRRVAVVAVVAPMSLVVASVHAQTLFVTTGDDAMDFAGAQRVADLPGPDGLVSLREATTAASNTPGPQTIAFAIPRSRWWPVLPNQATCVLDYSVFVTDADTTIDFTTQTALTGDTNPAGWEVAVYYAGAPTGSSPIFILADSCTVRGMDYVGGNALGAGVRIYGSNNRVVGCTGGSVAIQRAAPDAPPSSGNVIGGTAAEDHNRLASVGIAFGSSGNTVLGTTMNSLQIAGDTLYGPCVGNRVGGPTPEERCLLRGNARTGEEGLPTGVVVSLSHAHDTAFEGNYVGTTDDGLAMWPGLNGATGVSVGAGCRNTLLKDNLISGIARTGSNHYQGRRFGTAISVGEDAQDTRLVGNRLGLNATGDGTIPNVRGVELLRLPTSTLPVTDFLLGGDLPGEGNTITACEGSAITVHTFVAGIRISGNSIYNNGGLGIDLVDSTTGVTVNDPFDADTGGNNLQNFPVLATATTSGTSLHVEGVLASRPGREYRVECFANAACDASGFGEGQTFLGGVTVTTDAAGTAPIAADLAAAVTPGEFVTATATDLSTADTSEFSACRVVESGPPPCDPDYTADGNVDQDDIACLVAIIAGDPSCSPADPDFNHDGNADQSDLAALVNVVAGGACP